VCTKVKVQCMQCCYAAPVSGAGGFVLQHNHVVDIACFDRREEVRQARHSVW
jgi:hypothetical protein